MEDLILHPDIADPVMTLSDRDMGTLFKALMLYRWKNEEPKDLSAAADMAFIFIRSKMDMETEARKEYCRKQQERGKLQRKIQRKARKRNKTHFFELFVNIGIDTYLLRVILNS